MTSDSISGNGKASSWRGQYSADAQDLTDGQRRGEFSIAGRSRPQFAKTKRLENQLLRYLKQKAIEDAELKYPEEGRMSLHSGSTGARAEGSQREPKEVDSRFMSPKSMLEAGILDDALESTRAHYMDLIGEPAPSSPPFESYMSQWRFMQDQLDAHWIREGYSGEPPQLFILGPWSGALEKWRYLKRQDIADRKN